MNSISKTRIIVFLAIVIFATKPSFNQDAPQPGAEAIIDFLVKNPERASIVLTRNGESVVSQNPHKAKPLASTVKIVIAIEYAFQAAQGKVDPQEKIALADLEKFYLPNTDGGAHTAWKNYIATESPDSATIKQVAQGMIWFSSNANTEWLASKLGIDAINNRIDDLGLQSHTPVYYFFAALFIGHEAFPGITGKSLADSLRQLSDGEYIRLSETIHQKLTSDSDYMSQNIDLNFDVQRVWSDRLPAASAADYHKLMQVLNAKTVMPDSVHFHLDNILEFLMNNPTNAAWLQHAGMKGGSTMYLLTKALYATDKEGNTTELVYFMHDLNLRELMLLQNSMNGFEVNILSKPDFVEGFSTRFR
jgi:D-alanyl-D-alanine carboxypeptidase